MTNHLRIACAQLNPIVGDLSGNAALARTARDEARKRDADLVIFSELFIAGYPPEDLILKPALVRACMGRKRVASHRSSPCYPGRGTIAIDFCGQRGPRTARVWKALSLFGVYPDC